MKRRVQPTNQAMDGGGREEGAGQTKGELELYWRPSVTELFAPSAAVGRVVNRQGTRTARHQHHQSADTQSTVAVVAEGAAKRRRPRQSRRCLAGAIQLMGVMEVVGLATREQFPSLPKWIFPCFSVAASRPPSIPPLLDAISGPLSTKTLASLSFPILAIFASSPLANVPAVRLTAPGPIRRSCRCPSPFASPGARPPPPRC